MIDELNQLGLLRAGGTFLDVGSGIGTLVFAVNRWSEARAAGIEIHPGLCRVANSFRRRLFTCGAVDSQRLAIHQGDFRNNPELLSTADVLYVYSPIGTAAIQVDGVVEHMKPGATLVPERLPTERLADVAIQARVATLLAMRKK